MTNIREEIQTILGDDWKISGVDTVSKLESLFQKQMEEKVEILQNMKRSPHIDETETGKKLLKIRNQAISDAQEVLRK